MTRTKKATTTQNARPQNTALNSEKLTHLFVISFCLLMAIIYYFYGKLSDGFYQHDEAGHYLSMLGFWKDPNSVLGNWAKPGFKLIYALPALAGENFVHIFTILLSVATGYFTFRVARQFNSRYAILAPIFLLLQPLWMQLAFRPYSELLTALMLIMALFFHNKQKYFWSLFLLSYISLIRQEFYPLLAIYGILILWKKQWTAILGGIIPQVGIILWYGLAKGDWLALVSSIIGTSDKLAQAYPRQGLWHYPKFMLVIFGGIAVSLVIIFLFSKLLQRKAPPLLLWLPTTLFVGLHILFNVKSLDFGPATGGNLRYMLSIAPLIGVMATLAFDELSKLKRPVYLLIPLATLAIITGLYMTFEHNLITFSEERHWPPLVFVTIMCIVPLLPWKKWPIFIPAGFFILLSTASLANNISPYPLSEEDQTVYNLARWYRNQLNNNRGTTRFTAQNPVYAQHTLFYYYSNEKLEDLNNPNTSIVKENIETAPIGAIIIWDSHYSYRPKLRPNSLPKSYFDERAYQYEVLENFIAKDQRFISTVYLKVAKADPKFDQAVALFKTHKWQEALASFLQLQKKYENNATYWLFVGMSFQNNRKYQDAYNAYSISLQKDPSLYKALINRGNLLSMFNRNKRALTDLNKAIKLDKKNPEGFLYRGNHFMTHKDYKKALANYTEAIRLNPRYGQAYYMIGLTKIQQGDKHAGCTHLVQALKYGYKQAQQALDKYCKK